MNTNADSHHAESEPTTLDSVTIENDDAPDECAIFPRGVSDDILTTTWITAQADSFVSLESMR
ncbi:hypothetical protein SAMN04487967_0920 [Natronorubrum sediminis]|uniref:DUF7511 domain-containing protein n=1 Tax=Natronorubrum sediminis TaxID=640943 RepID=A0A1H6FSH3_9EURY|nr:hypothetical protein [Natronorubrum sediminis]SEH12694.1 hypothetical protein SAMN04487967_0920 [Natronorubrum sediminis]